VVIIGVDPHKRMHVASVVEPATNRQVAALEIEASLAGYRRLLKWADKFGERSWAVENTQGLGRHLTQWLLARGEVVCRCTVDGDGAGCGNCLVAADARMM
jgi:transposase